MADEQALKRDLAAIFDAALRASDAGTALRAHLPERPKGRVVLAACGKAAASMAAAAEASWGPLEGIAVTPHGYGLPLHCTRLIEATHPLPGPEAQNAAEVVLAGAQTFGADDTLLVLLSGGGSALWPLPVHGVSLPAKRALTQSLLASGAPISAINCVRAHLSRIKGGRLAAAAGAARVLAFAVSDVPGDDPAIIASGPVSPDPTTLAEARAVLAHYGVTPPAEIAAALLNPAHETPKPGDPCFARVSYRLVLRPAQMLAAAAAQAGALGYAPLLLGDALEGDAHDEGARQAQLAREINASGRRVALISGGELTVRVTGSGTGGRNRAFALALALGLDGARGIGALAADTDGFDGTHDAAGAIVLPSTLSRGPDAARFLAQCDSGGYFAALGDALVTGPTRTNVNDVRIILIAPP